MLPGLRSLDNDNITILTIWSGPGVINKWQMEELLQPLRGHARLMDFGGETKTSSSSSSVTASGYVEDEDALWTAAAGIQQQPRKRALPSNALAGKKLKS